MSLLGLPRIASIRPDPKSRPSRRPTIPADPSVRRPPPGTAPAGPGNCNPIKPLSHLQSHGAPTLDYALAWAFRHAAGGMPTIRLNARENAASES